MERKLFCILALCSVALTACQKEPGRFRAGDEVRFTAGSSNVDTEAGCNAGDTKAAYSGVSNNGKERIDWRVNDLLRIYCAQASEPSVHYADYKVTSVESSLSGSEELSRAHIEVSSPVTDGIGLRWGSGDHTFYAAFPSPATTGGITARITGNVITASLPETQGIVGNITKTGSDWVAEPDLTNMLMTAKATWTEATMPDESTVFLSFTPLTTAIQFTIKNDTGAQMDLTSVQLISGNGKSTAEPVINGAFSVDLDQTGIASGSFLTPYSGFNITYNQAFPLCTSTAQTSTNMSDRTVTINVGTATDPLSLAVNETFTFTFFLNPIHDFNDLTFKLTKSDYSCMSTRLGYTDGTGIFFPRHKKSFVTGLLVPEGAQWTVKYGSLDQGTLAVTKWEKGIEGYLPLKPKNNDLLPGKFSVSADKYVQFSRGNLLATRSSSSSDDWKLGFFANQYDFGTATSFSANDTEMSLFTFGFDSKETSFDPIGSTPGSEDWGNEYNRQYGLLLGTWQTLTGGPGGEWWYLLEGRPNAANLKVFKTVHEHSNCLIIFPDDFDLSDIPSSTELTDDQWSDLEAKGAVCLPQAGYRNASTYSTSSNGYWGNNLATSSNGNGLFFHNGANVTSTTNGAINYGYSIRLVQKFDKPNFVEIGGLKWAKTNVGANTPKECGWYFFWAGTEGYVWDRANKKWVTAQGGSELSGGFSWANTPYNTGGTTNTWKKYIPTDKQAYWTGGGSPDNKLSLDLEDDAAHAHWGSPWRMPTQAEFQKLYEACGGSGEKITPTALPSADPGKGIYFVSKEQTYISDYAGVAGILFCDDKRHKLFFVAAGYGTGGVITEDGSGRYWLGTVNSLPSNAYYLSFMVPGSVNKENANVRFQGYTVRPVSD